MQKKWITKWLLKFSILGCLLILISCSHNKLNDSEDSIKEEQLFSIIFSSIGLQPCPSTRLCWQGIELNVTTETEAKNILKQLYGDNVTHISHSTVKWTSSNEDDGLRGGEITFSNNKATWIEIYLKREILTIENFIQETEAPDFVNVISALSFPDLEKNCVQTWLVYSDISLEVHPFPSDNFAGIDPNQFITVLTFSSPLTEDFLNRPKPNNVYVEWQGYQDYCVFGVK